MVTVLSFLVQREICFWNFCLQICLLFSLDSLTITIKDEDKRDATILRLLLSQVVCDIAQRPSADNIKLSMTMENLSIEGLKKVKCPTIVKTRVHDLNKLLTISFEKNPPDDDTKDLDEDKGSYKNFAYILLLFTSMDVSTFDYELNFDICLLFETWLPL